MEVVRKRMGWSQTKLGGAADLSSTTVSRIETGRYNPTPQETARLARALKLKPHQVMERVEVIQDDFGRRAG
jgi:transcriptional regulator with XRE-family HTH domain